MTERGRSQFDNRTNDNTPTIFLRVDDAGLLNDVPGNAAGVIDAPPVDEVIGIPFNSTTGASPVGFAPGNRVAIYDETDTHAPVLLGFAQPVANLRGVYSFTFPNALNDGSHFISANDEVHRPPPQRRRLSKKPWSGGQVQQLVRRATPTHHPDVDNRCDSAPQPTCGSYCRYDFGASL